jgi:hypothetical protein
MEKKECDYYECKEKIFSIGDEVIVTILEKDGKTTTEKRGIVGKIIPQRRLQSTRYNVVLCEDKTTLREVNPVCMKKV